MQDKYNHFPWYRHVIGIYKSSIDLLQLHEAILIYTGYLRIRKHEDDSCFCYERDTN